MRAFWLLCRMRAVEQVRSPSSLGFFLGLPLLLLLAIGGMFAGGHPFERRQVALVVQPAELAASHAPAALAERIESTLSAYPEVHLQRLTDPRLALGQLGGHVLDAVLVIDGTAPDGLRLYTSERGRLFQRALLAVLAPVATLTAETIKAPHFGYVHYLFPGLLAFSILTAGLLGMGSAMARYRQNQLLKKLALTPLRRSTFVAAQLTARTLLGLLQVALLIVVQRVLFHLPVSPGTALWMLGVSGLGLLTFMGMGFLLAAVIRSEGLFIEMVSALMTPLVLLSEMFFPLSELPRPLQLLGEVLPSTLLVRLLRLGVHGGLSGDAAAWLPGVLLLGGWLVVSYALAVVFFRWND